MRSTATDTIPVVRKPFLLLLIFALIGCENFIPSDPYSPIALHQSGGQVLLSLGCERDNIAEVVIELGVMIDDPPGQETTVAH